MCRRHSAFLNPLRLCFGVLLRGVLCVATGSTGSLNGSSVAVPAVISTREPGAADRVSRDVRFLTSYGTASLYPTLEHYAGTERPRSTGGELVRLLEGGESGEDFEPDQPSPYAFSNQPFLHDQQDYESQDADDLRLFGSGDVGIGNQLHQHEPYNDPYAGGLVGQSDPFTEAAVAREGAGRDDESNSSYYPSPPDQSKDDLIVMAATPTLTRVSAFVRGMLQRFGVSQYIEAYQSREAGGSTGAISSNIQRLIPHRFRPHFVNTSKGLRNIPHQLNDGQLQLAPEDGATGSQPTAGGQPGGAAGGAAGAGSSPGSSSGTIGALFNSFKRKLKAIYPGTVWCGDGNQAKSEDDIGFFYLTDSCCRAHDLCPITINAGEQFNRLKNNGHFTRSHCDCDKQFFNCLKNANTLVSRQIGYTYFNLLKPQCFRYEHPKVNCTKRSRGKCLTYFVDDTQSKRWQWFDNLIF